MDYKEGEHDTKRRLSRPAFFRLALIILIAISGLSWVVTPAHAGTNITFRSVAHNSCLCSTGISAALTIATTGDALLVSIYGLGVFNGFVVSDTKGTTFTQRVTAITASGSGASVYWYSGFAGSAGSDTLTVTTGGANRQFGFSFMDYSNVLGFGITGSVVQDNVGDTGTSSILMSNTAGDGGAVVEAIFINAPSSNVFTNNQGQTIRDSGGVNPCPINAAGVCESTDLPISSNSFTASIAWSTSACAGACFVSHASLELTGVAAGTITTISQCYGNCGSPAVTLANTNSTHAVNWNQSITLFYQFQPGINGYLANITTSLTKNYPNGLYAPLLAFYKSICPLGQSPFSAQCPGTALLSGQTVGFSKGKQALTGGTQYVVTSSSNIWYGVALSFNIAPADVNDTNTNIQLFQTTGQTPTTMTSSSVFAAASKIGIWAWITGNVISSLPPPTPAGPCQNNFAQLDCLIPGMVNGMCTVLTASCRTSGALFWIIILTFLSFLVATVGFASAHITKFVGAGEVFLFLFLGWFFIFVGVGVLESFVVIFFLFIGSVAFAKTARNYF